MSQLSLSRNRATLSDMCIPGTDKDILMDQLLRHEFFLPAEMILLAESRGWTVKPISVLNNVNWISKEQQLLEAGCIMTYLPNCRGIINCSQYVGISVRKHYGLCTKIAVVKPWIVLTVPGIAELSKGK